MTRTKQPPIVRQTLISLALVMVTVAVYLPVRHNGFVDLDDNAFVTNNPNIRGGLTWRSVRWAFGADLTHADPNADYWRPLSFLSHALDIEMFGLEPAGHHLMNVMIHAAAAVTLFLVLQSMTNAPWRSAFAAALFALHPLRVESVAWVAERKDVLSGLFFMLTLGAYARYVRAPFSLRRYLLLFFLFALALMSKSMVMTLPFVLLLLDYWPLGRTRWAAPAVAGRAVAVTPGRLLMEKLPLFALTAASSLVTFLGNHTKGKMSLVQVSTGTGMANALLSYVRYIGKMVWPTGLAVWYPLLPGLSPAVIIAAGIGLVGVTAAVIWMAQRKPWLVTGWFWYLGMLVPVIGVFQGSGEAMADRFTYLPSIGLTLMLCWSVPHHLMERRAVKLVVVATAGVVLAICAALSSVQIGYWKDSETLFRHAVDVTRDNWLAHSNLGIVLAQSGRIDEAITHYNEALRIKPEFADVHYNLGIALERAGRMPEALDHLEHAVRIEPDFAEAQNNLGMALAQAGRLPEAIEHLEHAVRAKPEFAEAHYNLGTALGRAGRIPEAIQQFEQVLRIDPDQVDARNNLGFALALTGKTEQAIAQYEQALRIKPDRADVHFNLGNALVQVGRVPEAITEFEQALRIDPEYTQARNALARLQARQ